MLPKRSALFLTLWCASALTAEAQDCQNLDITKDGDAQKALKCIGDLERSQQSHNAAGSELLGHLDLDFIQNIEALVKRVETLETELADLKANTPDPIPDGAVLMLSQSHNGEDNHRAPCPRGWNLFQEAAGRMPIGAGQPEGKLIAEFSNTFGKYDLYDQETGEIKPVDLRPYKQDQNGNWLFYKPMDIGGAESIALTEAQMPSHTHATTPPVPDGFRHWGPFGLSNFTPTDFDYSRDFFPQPNYDQTTHYPLASLTGGGETHENMPPWIALYFCVKN